MTNTYRDDAPIFEKILEELRLIRCCLERWVMVHGNYSDYQKEKFFGVKNFEEKEIYITKTTSGACLKDEHAICHVKDCKCFCHEILS